MTMSMNEGVVKHFRYENEDLVVDKETDLVAYNDEKHVYVGKTGDSEGKKFISVTTLIGLYENKFDPEFWKRYKALESMLTSQEFKPIKARLLDTKKWDDGYLNGIDKGTFDLKCQEFVDAWALENKKACDWGTKVHAIQEMGFYNNPDEMIFKFNLGGKLPVHKNHHKFDCEFGIFPEMLLSFVDKDGVLRIAGQSDLVVKRGNKITIFDHKTNKQLDKESFYDRKKKSHVMMKYPLNNIMDCNMMHYTIQLSLYGYIIEYNNPELEIEALKIIHFTHDGEEVEYDLEYRKQDVIRLLKYHKKQLLIQEFNEARKPVIYE